MDIAHLKEIGEVETHTVFVDSAERDKTVFRNPNHYEIVFDRAFENIVGVDVLDASIPSTLYIVDSHNNSLAMSYRIGGTPDTVGKSIPEYLEALKGSSSFQEVVDDPDTPHHRFKIVAQYGDHSLAEEEEGSAYHVVYNRTLAIQPLSPESAASVPGEVLHLGGRKAGFSRATVTSEGLEYRFRYAGEARDRVLATFFQEGTQFAIISTIEPLTSQVQFSYCRAEALKGIPMDDVVEVSFQNGVASAVEGHSHKRVSREFYEGVSVFVHEYHSQIVRIEVGDHDIDALAGVLLQAMPRYSPTGTSTDLTEFAVIQSFSTSYPNDFSRDRRFLYRGRGLFWFDMKKSTAASVLGFSEVAEENQGYQVIPGVNNRFLFGAVKRTDTLYEMYSPGMINLFGEKFVVLRCPQIEENGNASLSYERYSAGIGIFKLYNSTVAHLRFDFTNLRKLDMHPIGKLSKLTLRFERANGDLYDFKGVDHHLLLAIKFLKPMPKMQMVEPERRLNPDYKPDTLRFLTTYYEDDLDETSTEDDDDLLEDVRHRARFLKARAG